MTARVWLAEFVGTFALLFAGIAVIAAGAGSLATAAAFGLSVTAMIAAVGPISFAHFNPAVPPATARPRSLRASPSCRGSPLRSR